MNKPTLLLLVGAALVGTVGMASADDNDSGTRRTNGLAKAVAVRNRRLLVSHRFEVTPLFESSIDAEYQHTVGGGLKLEYHIGDMLSIGVLGVGSTSLHTRAKWCRPVRGSTWAWARKSP